MRCRIRVPSRLSAALAIAVVALLSGCASSTRFTNLWKDPAWSQAPMKKVLVVALRKDPIRRRMWEDGLVAALARHGVAGTPSYPQFPEAAPDSQQVAAQVGANGYDGVMLSMRLPNQTQTTHIPGTTRMEPVTRRNPFVGGYSTYYREVQEPSRVEVDQVRLFQTDLWETRGEGRLVWSGTVETLESVSTDMVKRIAAGHIVEEIASQGLVPPKAAR